MRGELDNWENNKIFCLFCHNDTPILYYWFLMLKKCDTFQTLYPLWSTDKFSYYYLTLYPHHFFSVEEKQVMIIFLCFGITASLNIKDLY